LAWYLSALFLMKALLRVYDTLTASSFFGFVDATVRPVASGCASGQASVLYTWVEIFLHDSMEGKTLKVIVAVYSI